MQLWHIHNAEQMIMDDMEINPDKYKDKKLSELTDDEDFDEENSVEYAKTRYKKSVIPLMILVRIFFGELHYALPYYIYMIILQLSCRKQV